MVGVSLFLYFFRIQIHLATAPSARFLGASSFTPHEVKRMLNRELSVMP
jgi:hypothetical protein